MKRTYSTPSAEKLAFKYRDQVVAASGDPTLNQSGGGTGSSNGIEQIIQGIIDSILGPDYQCSFLF